MRASQSEVFNSLGVPKTPLGNLWGQSYFCNNTNVLPLSLCWHLSWCWESAGRWKCLSADRDNPTKLCRFRVCRTKHNLVAWRLECSEWARQLMDGGSYNRASNYVFKLALPVYWPQDYTEQVIIELGISTALSLLPVRKNRLEFLISGNKYSCFQGEPQNH